MKKYEILNFKRICPDCKKIIVYKYKRSCERSEKNKSSCRKCMFAKSDRVRTALRKTDPEYKARMRRYGLKSRYGISIEEYEEMKKSQGGHCAVCNSIDKLFVDHDHKTGLTRGLLCRHHNLMLGYMERDIRAIDKLIEYLLFHKEQSK